MSPTSTAGNYQGSLLSSQGGAARPGCCGYRESAEMDMGMCSCTRARKGDSPELDLWWTPGTETCVGRVGRSCKTVENPC